MHVRCAIVLLAVAAVACASPTPYQAATDRYGFEDSQIEANRYRIRFAGNSVTDRETVETYLLYRAAEITLAAGGDHFRIADRDLETETDYHTTVFPNTHFLYGKRFRYRSLAYDSAFGSNATTTRITRYTAIAEILVASGGKPQDDAQAYDARQIVETLGPRLRRPETGKKA